MNFVWQKCHKRRGLFSLGRQNLLNTDLIDVIGQMRSFLIICQVGANSVGHHHNESAVIHIQPIAAANEFLQRLVRTDYRVRHPGRAHKSES